MDCSWLGPHSSVLRLKMPDKTFEKMYRDYVARHGRSADVTVSVKLLEGEDPILLKDGYVSESEGREVLVVVDLLPDIMREFEEKANFRDYVISEEIRREEIEKIESDKPHLQRFRIAMEED